MSDFFTWSVDAATVIGPESQLENPKPVQAKRGSKVSNFSKIAVSEYRVPRRHRLVGISTGVGHRVVAWFSEESSWLSGSPPFPSASCSRSLLVQDEGQYVCSFVLPPGEEERVHVRVLPRGQSQPSPSSHPPVSSQSSEHRRVASSRGPMPGVRTQGLAEQEDSDMKGVVKSITYGDLWSDKKKGAKGVGGGASLPP
eukprot:1553622-Rhodomonas_salina.1